MLQSEEILELLRNSPQGFLKPDNNLFASSDSNLLQKYKKLGAIYNQNEISDDTLTDSTNKIFCNVFGCCAVFDNIASYQSHYNAIHRFICAECKKSLPTDHLLDLHISEYHDSYFRARIDRGERLFKCYLEDCKEVFLDFQERKDHCVNQHKFPSNFRFDQIVRKSFERRKQLETAEMEDEDIKNINNGEFKQLSFGHQREKTFLFKTEAKQKPGSSEALQHMDMLKDALK